MIPFLKNIKLLFFVSFITLAVVSCKSKTAAADVSKNENRKSVNKIIENYYNNKNEFSTLYIKASVQYATEKQNQNVTAEIKLKKDEQIFLGREISQHRDYSEDTAIKIDQEVKKIGNRIVRVLVEDLWVC